MVSVFHPMFVHFPIALLILAGIASIIDFSSQKYDLKTVILWNLIAGTLGSLIAVLSGFRDSEVIPHNEVIHAIMEIHEKLGVTIAVLSFVLSGWFFMRKSLMKRIENLYFVLAMSCVIIIILINSFLGGKMVYDNGAGIKPMEKYFQVDSHEHNS